MSKITKPGLLDETGQQMLEAMKRQNVLLNVIAGTQIEQVVDCQQIANIVRAGNADKVFNIGDQITTTWTDIATGIKYSFPFDVVHFGNVTLQDGESIPGMYLQLHYSTPFDMSFDGYEAFYKVPNGGLKAGTYYVTVSGNWGTYTKDKEVWNFTLTHDVPEGGVLAGFQRMPDVAPADWRISSYSSASSRDPIETVSVASGVSGTSLGTFEAKGNATLNSYQRTAYGYNRWSQSAIRQWLNSKAGKDAWWKSQNDYDMQPDQLKDKAGFMTGFDADFLSMLKPVKVTTALNNVSDTGIEDDNLEDTYDTFFLPSLSQENITPELAGEGDTFEYWKRASESSTPLAQYQTYPQMITYAVDNHSSPQFVRLRSAHRGHASSTWYVDSSGDVGGRGAINAGRCAPACVVC